MRRTRSTLTTLVVLILALGLMMPPAATAQNTEPFEHYAPVDPVPANTPYSVAVRVNTPGQITLIVGGSEIPFAQSQGYSFAYAYIPADQLAGGSQLSYEIRHVDSNGKAFSRRYALTVGQDASGSSSGGIQPMIVIQSGKTRTFHDLRPDRTTMPDGTDVSMAASYFRSPARNADGTDLWPMINATHNQPRDPADANPHSGVDFDIRGGSVVYAAADGTVVSAVSGRVTWTMTQYPTAVVDYQHLSTIYVTNGQHVTQGTKIGIVDSTANHLHVGWGYYKSLGTYYWMPEFWAWSWHSVYNDGKDVDWFGNPTLSSTGVLSINVKGKNVGVDVPASEVRVVHRKWGTSTWTDSPMTNSSGYTWTVNLKSVAGYTNTTVEYYIYSKRSGYPDEPVFKPAYYNMYKTSSTGSIIAPPPDEFIVGSIQ